MNNKAVKNTRRPLHYENFEERVRNYCQREIRGEFTEIELKAIVYDYLNVVYRGMWKADDRYSLVEGTIRELTQQLEINNEELKDRQGQLNVANAHAAEYRRQYEYLIEQQIRSICYKVKKFFNNFKSYFQTGER